MADKILSVIIPSYNMEAYLPKCLGSLVIDDKELLQKLDVIVVNDGSKDHTSEIAHEFEMKYSGVFRVIDKPNGHYGSCINAVLPEAKGVFVKVLDADDWFDTEDFEAYLRLLDGLSAASSQVDLIINDFDIVYESGKVRDEWRYSLSAWEAFDVNELIGMEKDIIMHAVAFRTKNMREMNYRQTEGCLYTDNEWVVKGMTAVSVACFFPRPLYKYLCGREGQSGDSAVLKKNAYQHIAVTDRLVDYYIHEHGKYSEAQRWLIEKYLARMYRGTLNMFLRDPFSSSNRSFYALDSKFKGVLPIIRKEIGGDYVMLKRFGRPYRYVNAWQNYRHFRWLPLVVFRTYVALQRGIRLLKIV